jgi:hypothetical protein
MWIAGHPTFNLDRPIQKKRNKPSFRFDISPMKQKWCRNQSRLGDESMDKNQPGQNSCEVCHESFDSAQELQSHRQSAHQENKPADRQGKFDIESDQQRREKIA